MGKDPSMPFYVNDWLSSPRVQSMTQSQELAYFRLCLFCWASGDASIPDDDDALATISRMGKGWLKGGSTVVRKCFNQHPTKPGFLTNDKLLSLWNERQEWREKSRLGGIKSAQKRTSVGTNGGSRVVQPKGNSSSSSSSSLCVSSKEETLSERKRFVRPTVDQVAAYCEERENFVDPEAFVNHYESKGWKIGSGPMKDWQAAVRTWEAKHKPPASRVPTAEDLANYNPIDGGLRR